MSNNAVNSSRSRVAKEASNMPLTTNVSIDSAPTAMATASRQRSKSTDDQRPGRRRLRAQTDIEEVIRDATWSAHEAAQRHNAEVAQPRRADPRSAQEILSEMVARLAIREPEPEPNEALATERFEHKRHDHLMARGVPKLFLDVNVDLARPPPHYPAGYRRLAERVQRVVDEPAMRALGGPTMAILGPVGVGKSALACGGLAYSYDLGRPYVFYRQALLYLKELLHPKASQVDIVRKFCNAQMVVLDDLHDKGQSLWANGEIRLLVDLRHNAKKPTILITNLRRDDFVREIGPQVERRIKETGDIHYCDWPWLQGLKSRALPATCSPM